MTIIEQFIQFAASLEDGKRSDVETVLTQVMTSYSSTGELSPELEKEDLRRINDPNPKYATQAEIDNVWGKALPQ